MTDVEFKLTNRGFKHYVGIPSTYGGEIKVAESSAASGPHVWVWADYPVNLNDPNGERLTASMHLTLEDAERLRDQLTHVIENHYQEV